MLDARPSKVTIEMKYAAAKAIAEIIADEDLHPKYIIPNALGFNNI